MGEVVDLLGSLEGVKPGIRLLDCWVWDLEGCSLFSCNCLMAACLL